MNAGPSLLRRRALHAIRMDAAQNTIRHQHDFLCHSDGSDCEDGCDVAADPTRLKVLNQASEDFDHEVGIPTYNEERRS